MWALMRAQDIYEQGIDKIDGIRIFVHQDCFGAKQRRRVKKFVPHFMSDDFQICGGVYFYSSSSMHPAPCLADALFWVKYTAPQPDAGDGDAENGGE